MANRKRPAEPQATSEDLVLAAERLRTLTVETEQFLMEQLTRLDETLQALVEQAGDAVPPVPPEVGAAWEAEREAWLRQRDAEVDELRQEQEALIAAWDRVESLQRTLLVRQEWLQARDQAAGGARTGVSPETDENSSVFAPGSGTQSMFDAAGATNGTGGTGAEQPPLSRESALLHVEQLRREIRRHALNRRHTG